MSAKGAWALGSLCWVAILAAAVAGCSSSAAGVKTDTSIADPIVGAEDFRTLGEVETDLKQAERALHAELVGGTAEQRPPRAFPAPPAATLMPHGTALPPAPAPPPPPIVTAPPVAKQPWATPPQSDRTPNEGYRNSRRALNRCVFACRALASMARSATRLCLLTGVGDRRCQSAQNRVRAARVLVRSSCPACSH